MKRKIAFWLALLFYCSILPAWPAAPVVKDLIVKDSPWVDVQAYSTFALANTAASTSGKALLVTSQVTISATITVTVPVMVLKGGSFSIDNGVILRLYGSFSAGIYEVFSGDGNVAFGYNSTPNVYPEWFGAVGDINVTDDSVAMQKALYSLHPTTPLLFTSLYRINQDLTYTYGNRYSFTIKGTNYRYTGLRYYGDNTLLTMSFDVSTSLPILFDNFQMVSYNVTDNTTAVRVLDLNHNSIYFTNLDVQGFRGNTFDMIGGVDLRWVDVDIQQKGNGIGIYIAAGATAYNNVMTIKNSSITGPGGDNAASTAQALKIYHAQGPSTVKGCLFHSWYTSVPIVEFFGTGGNKATINLDFSDNYFELNYGQNAYISFTSLFASQIINNYFTSNAPGGAEPNYLIEIKHGNGTVISNNSFFDPTVAYISLPTANNVGDLIIHGNGYNGNFSYIDAPGTDMIARNIRLYDLWGAGYGVDNVANLHLTSRVGGTSKTLLSTDGANNRVTIPSGKFFNITDGGSATVSSGVGSVNMSSANAATNSKWIPIQYGGTTYYVPAWTTHAP